MKYLDARSKIESGDLLAWSHRGWGSWYDLQVQAVRIFTRSEYCHVGVAWVVSGRVFVVEAVSSGIRIFPLSRLAPFYWLPEAGAWNADAERWALGRIGAPYSKMEAVKAFLGLPLDAGRWQCAEFVVGCYQAAGCAAYSRRRATPSAVVADAQALGAACYLISADDED